VGFSVINRMGEFLVDANDEAIGAVLDELDGPHDEEHPEVCLVHESEWSLSAFPSGLVIFENVEDDSIAPRHLRDVPREKVRHLWGALAQGDFEVLEAEAEAGLLGCG
jgi:hypothetical protein